MLMYTVKFEKKKAVFAVVMAALVLIGIILLLGASDHGSKEDISTRPIKSVTDVRNEKHRVAYLAQYGWSVESPAMSEAEVVIPRTFSAVLEAYNDLQKSQGFDLSEYCGTKVTMYTYRVKNEEFAGDEVLAILYVSNGCVVGGDVHSTAMDGFMYGIK